MAGASQDHALLVTNLALVLGPLARQRGCRLYVAGMKLKVGESTVHYPDPLVVCAPPPANPYYEEDPCLVVEVLSPSTEATDRREKLWRYLSLPSLQGYILVQTQERRMELYRREGEHILYRATRPPRRGSYPCRGGPGSPLMPRLLAQTQGETMGAPGGVAL